MTGLGKVLPTSIRAKPVHGGQELTLAAGTEYDTYTSDAAEPRIVTFTAEGERVWLQFWRVDEAELREVTMQAEAER